MQKAESGASTSWAPHILHIIVELSVFTDHHHILSDPRMMKGYIEIHMVTNMCLACYLQVIVRE